jgi:AcrR family transcriptional regulator
MPRGRAASYDEQRALIVAHAAALFAARGYPATSMNQVAAAAGLSKAALYHYVADTYRLLVEIAEGHVSRLDAIVAEVGALALAPDARVRMLIERIMAEYADAQDAHRVLTSEVRFLEPVDRRRIVRLERRVVEGFADAIGAWQPGQRDAHLTKPLTMLLFGMVNWMFTWLKADGPLSYASMAPVVTALFFGGVPTVQAPVVGKNIRSRSGRARNAS